jgi:hypothetical protein
VASATHRNMVTTWMSGKQPSAVDTSTHAILHSSTLKLISGAEAASSVLVRGLRSQSEMDIMRVMAMKRTVITRAKAMCARCGMARQPARVAQQHVSAAHHEAMTLLLALL